ncbi:MAG: hypothetical protein ABJ360_28825 [Roseobacter sp.]
MNIREAADRLALPVLAGGILVLLFWEGGTERDCVRRLGTSLDETTEFANMMLGNMVRDPDYERYADVLSVQDMHDMLRRA